MSTQALKRQQKRPAAWVRALVCWFETDHRPMPWRSRPSRYAVWVSEIMLQQTQVDTVMPYFRRFMRRFPSLRRLAAAPEREVLKLWEGLGYYARARNLHRAARLVARERNGRIPDNAAALRRLPGIGDYSAAAIASIACGEAVPTVDGNVLRVMSRLRASGADIAKPQTRDTFKAYLQPHIRTTNPSHFNQALMELGALICRPRHPACERCPVRRWCKARRAGTVERYPVKRRAPAAPRFDEVAAVIRAGGKLLVARRHRDGMLGGLWELPGGRCAAGETPAAALPRLLAERTGLTLRTATARTTIKHAFSHFKITLHVFDCDTAPGPVRPGDGYSSLRWLSHASLGRLPCTHTTRAALESAAAR